MLASVLLVAVISLLWSLLICYWMSSVFVLVIDDTSMTVLGCHYLILCRSLSSADAESQFATTPLIIPMTKMTSALVPLPVQFVGNSHDTDDTDLLMLSTSTLMYLPTHNNNHARRHTLGRHHHHACMVSSSVGAAIVDTFSTGASSVVIICHWRVAVISLSLSLS